MSINNPKSGTESSESGLPVKPDKASIAKRLKQELIASGWKDATGKKGFELIGVERSQPSPEKPSSDSPDPAAKPYQPATTVEELKAQGALHGIHLGPEDEPFMQELLSRHKPTNTEKP
jgi:hypothetical protein